MLRRCVGDKTAGKLAEGSEKIFPHFRGHRKPVSLFQLGGQEIKELRRRDSGLGPQALTGTVTGEHGQPTRLVIKDDPDDHVRLPPIQAGHIQRSDEEKQLFFQ